MRGWLFALALLLPTTAHAQTFDNAAVIALHKAGLGKDTLLAKIRALPCNYDTSTAQLIALKQAGLEDAVIAEMVKRCDGTTRAQGVDDSSADPRAPHSPGIYLEADWQVPHSLQRLRPTASASIKVTGNGSLLFPKVVKLQVPQGAALLTVPVAWPAFWFYFNAADSKVGDFGTVSTTAAQSPAEFSLVRLKADGPMRQVTVGRAVPYAEVAGVDGKYAIPFTTHELGDGIFQVTPGQSLAPGEYAFIIVGEKGHFRIYDFAVAAAVK